MDYDLVIPDMPEANRCLAGLAYRFFLLRFSSKNNLFHFSCVSVFAMIQDKWYIGRFSGQILLAQHIFLPEGKGIIKLLWNMEIVPQ